ncbi:MAG: hypothetical protein ACOH5I_18340 [Oligoflexus sp.]
MSQSMAKNRRNHLRFSLGELEVAYLAKSLDADNFQPELVGLISDESYNGARLVFAGAVDLQEGEECLLQVGKLPLSRAKIQWIKQLESDVVIAGFQYLELD